MPKVRSKGVSALKRMILVTLCVISALAGMNNSFAAPFFSEAGKQAVILSPLENWMPTWNRDAYVSPLERAGYQVDVLLNGNVSISFLKTGLAKYDVIILRTDSFQGEGPEFYCAGDPVTSRTRAAFSKEIAAQEVEVGICVGFSILFLQHNYPVGSLRRGLVVVVGSPAGGLSSAFTRAGSAAFVGYYDVLNLNWGRIDCLTQKLLAYLSEGSTVRDSVIQLNNYIYRGHGATANWPSIFWYGEATFKI